MLAERRRSPCSSRSAAARAARSASARRTAAPRRARAGAGRSSPRAPRARRGRPSPSSAATSTASAVRSFEIEAQRKTRSRGPARAELAVARRARPRPSSRAASPRSAAAPPRAEANYARADAAAAPARARPRRRVRGARASPSRTSGAVHRVDEWAVRHAMPGLSPRRQAAVGARERRPVPARLAARPRARSGSRRTSGRCRRRRSSRRCCSAAAACSCSGAAHRGAAVAWAGVWLAGNAIEALTKHVLERPRSTRSIAARASTCSASTTRTRAGTRSGRCCSRGSSPRSGGASARRRRSGRRPRCRSSLVAGFHTPSDLVGGVLLAGLLLALVALVTRDTARS